MNLRFLIAAAIGVVLIAIVAISYAYANFSTSHTFERRFAKLPQDDIALQAWAVSQPGVKSATITRIGDRITILYKMRGGAEPDASKELTRLGYE